MRNSVWVLVLVLVAVLLPASAGEEGTKATAPEELFPVTKDGKSGYIDRTGRIVIEPQFQSAGRFADGMAIVSRDGRTCYIDGSGKVVIELDPTLTIAREFSEGLAIVGWRGPGDAIEETLGFIDQTGKIVIPIRFAQAREFSQGLAMVAEGHLCGFIDKTGAYVIKAQYELAESFSEGLACVGSMVQGLQKEHFIDHTGKRAMKQDFRFIDDFHEGLAAVWVGEEKGFIDRSGTLVIKPAPWNSVDYFSDGMARVQSGGPMGQGGKLGFIDRSGKLAVKPQYDFTERFSDGLCAVRVGENWGYIDKTGAMAIEPKFGTATAFQNGLAAVVLSTGNDLLYIDTQGKTVWPPEK